MKRKQTTIKTIRVTFKDIFFTNLDQNHTFKISTITSNKKFSF